MLDSFAPISSELSAISPRPPTVRGFPPVHRQTRPNVVSRESAGQPLLAEQISLETDHTADAAQKPVTRKADGSATIHIACIRKHALPHGKSSFVRFKHLFSSDSELVSPPRPQPRSSALERERNMAFLKEKEEDVS
jgi:hypothetical protein